MFCYSTLNLYHGSKFKIMGAANLSVNLPLNFSQVAYLVKQLPFKEKLKLSNR